MSRCNILQSLANDLKMTICVYCDTGGSAKSHGAGKQTYKHFNQESKHQNPQQPEWLLILEVTTGVLIIVFCITATITALTRCTPKPCVKVPWKKSTNWQDQIPITIGNSKLIMHF